MCFSSSTSKGINYTSAYTVSQRAESGPVPPGSWPTPPLASVPTKGGAGSRAEGGLSAASASRRLARDGETGAIMLFLGLWGR